MRNFSTSFVVALVLGCGCQSTNRTSANEGRVVVQPRWCYVFIDRRQSHREHTYYFRDSSVFIRVGEFPDYPSPQWYLIDRVPSRLTDSLRHWISADGDKDSMFPSHVWYSRTAFSPDTNQPPQTVFFPFRSLQGKEMDKWFQEVRRATVKRKYRTSTVPQWIKDEPRIDKRFGLGEKFPY